MRSKFLLLFLLSFILSCSVDPFFTDESDELIAKVKIDELKQGEDQLSTRFNDIIAERVDVDIEVAAAGDYDPLCVDKCNSDNRGCYDWALENRDWRLADCESIRIIGVEVTDIYCTRTVLVGYEQIEVYSPEGELIRIDEIPIYVEEEYICDQDEINIYTDDPVLLQEYQACRNDALDEFVAALEDCDIQQMNCLGDCEKSDPK